MKKLQKFKVFVWIFLIILTLSDSMIARADDNTMDGKRVLFISSYSYAWDTVQIQIEGIKDGLGADVVLDYEFMDTKRVSDETAEQLFYEGLQYRMEHVAPYDVVILGDDAALLFALEYQEELFAEIPLVFEGVNDEKLAVTAAQDPMITGVLEKLSVEKNIDLGLQLIPKASKVVAILDDTITGQAERERFYSVADKYPQLAFAEINTSDLSSSNLKRELRNVSEDTILIYVVMTEDADGKQYTNKESVQLIAKEASVPAIRMVEGGIGEGLLGGNVVSMHQSGKLAADIAMQVLNGRSISEIDVIMESPNIYCLDEEVMRKFDLDLALIPEGATIVNSKEDFFERNREVLVPGGILLIAMLVILLVMGYDNFRRRKLMQELQKAKLIMESASKHDFLTGLSNRSKFMEDLEQLVREDKQCTVMMIDIDDFKTINDSYGHTAGDEALKQVANRLIEMQSPILTAYRFAGDEFIILLRSGQSKIIEKTAFSCRQIFSKMFYLDGHKHKVCGSIGVASFPKDADNLEQLIVCADDAMYQVKKSGKNDFAIYQPEFSKGKTEEKDT